VRPTSRNQNAQHRGAFAPFIEISQGHMVALMAAVQSWLTAV
jgi:hypothetical protein